MYATQIDRALDKNEFPAFLADLASMATKQQLIGMTLHCFIDIDPNSPTYGKMLVQGEIKEFC